MTPQKLHQRQNPNAYPISIKEEFTCLQQPYILQYIINYEIYSPFRFTSKSSTMKTRRLVNSRHFSSCWYWILDIFVNRFASIFSILNEVCEYYSPCQFSLYDLSQRLTIKIPFTLPLPLPISLHPLSLVFNTPSGPSFSYQRDLYISIALTISPLSIRLKTSIPINLSLANTYSRNSTPHRLFASSFHAFFLHPSFYLSLNVPLLVLCPSSPL